MSRQKPLDAVGELLSVGDRVVSTPNYSIKEVYSGVIVEVMPDHPRLSNCVEFGQDVDGVVWRCAGSLLKKEASCRSRNPQRRKRGKR